MLFRSKTAIQIVFQRRLEKSNLSKVILQFENRVIFSALTQTISAMIILSNAEQLIQFSAFATVLSNSIKGATKRPNIKLKASIPGSESLVGPRLRSISRSKTVILPQCVAWTLGTVRFYQRESSVKPYLSIHLLVTQTPKRDRFRLLCLESLSKRRF